MHPFPHVYQVTASGAADGLLKTMSPGLPTFMAAPPAEFDGPGDQWSPETLLCAALADCLILTFRAVARGSKFEWKNLACQVKGTLSKETDGLWFTHVDTAATLTVPMGADVERAKQLVEKAEKSCLLSNSLRATRALTVKVVTAS